MAWVSRSQHRVWLRVMRRMMPIITVTSGSYTTANAIEVSQSRYHNRGIFRCYELRAFSQSHRTPFSRDALAYDCDRGVRSLLNDLFLPGLTFGAPMQSLGASTLLIYFIASLFSSFYLTSVLPVTALDFETPKLLRLGPDL